MIHTHAARCVQRYLPFLLLLFSLPCPAGAVHENAAVTLPDFVVLAKKLTPVTVNISTSKTVKPQQRQFGDQEQMDPYRDFFGDEFYRHFFGDPRQYRQKSLGSGFIIDSAGFVLTNNHVIEGADVIKVKSYSAQEYDADVVGRDPDTDLALLKIRSLKEPLTAATFGDSDSLGVGEWVLAIGNPFGLQETVTAGIVSAKLRRNLGTGRYENYIQTDASINPGNSGGPLFNTRGEVVGVNTLIFSPSGGNVGIGFAIPVNLAKSIVTQLKEKGRVVRGWLGVVVQTVTPELAKSFALEQGKGALVSDVDKDGPAARAGITSGDVIVAFDGSEVHEMSDLPLLVAGTPVGKKVNIDILRSGSRRTVAIIIGELKEKQPQQASRPEKPRLGLLVREITPELAQQYDLAESSGVIVSSVEPGSPAEDADMQPGDIIKEVNRKAVKSLDDYTQAIGGIQEGNILMLVRRDGTSLWIVIKPIQ
jgi:serine protease Do